MREKFTKYNPMDFFSLFSLELIINILNEIWIDQAHDISRLNYSVLQLADT